uniref:Ig-like domain-containing protein n=1 Tax=Myripristis murdjan TaxID=586833 RepID=A0A667YSS5_9TELE
HTVMWFNGSLAAAPEVLQSGEQTSHPGVTVTLGCSMAPGFSMSSYTMLWYRQTLYGTPIEYLTNEFEKVVGRFQSFLDASNNNFSLEITKLLLNDSGTYYCAFVVCSGGTYPAYFGEGTRLTVLEYNVTAPTVKILPPSSKECKNKKKTLVCVASGFYPDHVSVFWQIDEVTETNGVATDNNAVRKNESYSITSRLRVSAKDCLNVNLKGSSPPSCRGTPPCSPCAPGADAAPAGSALALPHCLLHLCLASAGPPVSFSALLKKLFVFKGSNALKYSGSAHLGSSGLGILIKCFLSFDHAEYNVTAPTVKILPPSSKECKKKKKTLVCVASGFYPDHVSVFWQIDGVDVTDGVATDNNAVRKNESYSITSRLRVLAEDWRSPDRTFTCTVTFFNGTGYEPHSDSVHGTAGKSLSVTPVSFKP